MAGRLVIATPVSAPGESPTVRPASRSDPLKVFEPLSSGKLVSSWIDGSTVTVRIGLSTETLPAASVAIALKACAPVVSVAVVNDHRPAESLVRVVSSVAPSKRAIDSPASPEEPLRVITVAEVVVPKVTKPGGETPTNESTFGASGAVASMVMVGTVNGVAETLPARSVAVAVKLWGPSARLAVVMLQTPPATVVLPAATAPSRSEMMVPFSPVPLIVSVRSLVRPSPAAPESVEKPV